MNAFAHGIVMKPGDWTPDEETDVAKFYVETIHSNISNFVRDKNHLLVNLQDGGESFDQFLTAIDADGDLDAARATWKEIHNAR
jgi:hypothetical protein